MNLEYKVFTWDWKNQPDWYAINKFLDDFESTPYFHQVDTDSDSYAVMVANRKLENWEIKHYYNLYVQS
jgi:hypothetical protein